MGYALPYKLRIHGKTLYIVNVHGKARPVHKLDTPARLRQSKLIIDFLENKATRNRLSWESLKKGEEKQYHADYVFTSPGVKVNSFEAPVSASLKVLLLG